MAEESETNNNSTTTTGDGTTTATKTVVNGGQPAVTETSPAVPSNRSRSVYWTPDEQSLLNKYLTKCASSNLVKRYAIIVLKLQEKKTLNDVALRYRWMTKKSNGKQRKDDGNSSRKHNEINEKAAYQQIKPSSHATNHVNGVNHARSPTSMDSIDIGTPSQLLERNDQAANQILANGSAFKEKATNQSNGLHHAPLSTSTDSDEDTDDNTSCNGFDSRVVQLLEQNEQAMIQISANMSPVKVYGNNKPLCQMINNMSVLMNITLNDIPDMEKSARQRYNFSMDRHLHIGQ